MSPPDEPAATGQAPERAGRIWFVDTASLLTMAVDPAIEAEVLAAIGSDTVVIIDIVADELEMRATDPQTAALAATARSRLPAAWQQLATAKYVTLDDIKDVQDSVADGRVLAHDKQHWAESVIIALCVRSRTDTEKVLLSDDYDARRVAHKVDRLTAVSIHRVLYERVQAGLLDAEVAATLSDKIEAADRGREVTADDFLSPTPRTLGRVGQP